MADYKNPLHLDVTDCYLWRIGDKTIPGEVYICYNQGVVDSLIRSPTKRVLTQNTTIPACHFVPHHLHPNKDMARSYTCIYGDAKDGYLWCKIIYAVRQDYSSISINFIKHHCTGAIYDILVSWITCHVYRYAHKPQFNVRINRSLN